MKIIGISGSLRQNSVNTKLLRAAGSLLPEDVSFEIIDLRVFPLFDADLEHSDLPAEMWEVQRAIAEADGVLIASPEYNHSYTGVLKNALDWISRPPIRALSEMPVAVIGASPGHFGAARGQMNLRQLLHAMNAHVLPKPELLMTQAPSKFDTDGTLIDEATRTVYQTLLDTFVQYIEVFTRPAQPA